MSKLGHHNFINRETRMHAVLRVIVLRRSDETFQSDDGAVPVSQAQAYDMGVDGQDYLMTRRRTVTVLPPMSTDCIRPFDAGLEIGTLEREQFGDDDWSHYDDRDPDPMDSVHSAYMDALYAEMDAKWLQERGMWQAHEQVPDAPMYLVRVRDNTTARNSW